MRAVRRLLERIRRSWPEAAGDAGSAVLEFLALSVVLLVPLVYLVLVLGRVQAATFAAEGAARTAARAYVVADTPSQGAARAVASVGLALEDQGFDDDPDGALTLTCSSAPCLRPGSEVAARVDVLVPLPFVPAFVRSVVPLEVPVSAERTAAVDTYRAAP
ncbi:pilus assembly protein [Cellulomonas soli]|uniref:pilus assembly protein n=1 Tax=Cellulomonas soli TaxID=931535 RepID=UPI003F8636B5